MASAAAQAYFNTFIPEQQEMIRQSWGGADLMDQWFQNAVNAGAATPEGQPNQGQGATEASKAAGGMTAAQMRQKAQSEGWSEDFERFDDATLQGWINQYWDPQRGKFRSQHAPPGATGDWVYAEKPTESVRDPEGNEWGPHGTKSGVNLTALGLGGGGGGQGVTGGATNNNIGDDSYLQNKLVNLFERGAFGDSNPAQRLSEGGVWWADPATAPAPAAPLPAPPPTGGAGPAPAATLANTSLFGGGAFSGGNQAGIFPGKPGNLGPQNPDGSATQVATPVGTVNSAPIGEKLGRLNQTNKWWKAGY